MKSALLRKLIIIVIFFTTNIVVSNVIYIPSQPEIATVKTEAEYLAQEKIQIPFVGNSFIGFREALGFKESQCKYQTINTYGYLGKYQFSKGTLERFNIYEANIFLNTPELQEKAFRALCSVNKWILRKDIRRSVGKTINGTLITESGILAAAHLSGAGNVKKFLRSNGEFQFQDAFGTSLQYYLEKFSGFDTSLIESNRTPELGKIS